jgi:salicylate 5-hydroxylase large subunit
MTHVRNVNDFDRIPYWLYTDQQIYQRELDNIWYGDHWNYVALECELPSIGDYRLNWIGERQIIVVRSATGIQVLENRCKHRGMRFQQGQFGNVKKFVCAYHQWKYDLEGNLVNVPFEHGAPKNGKICGGMPQGFEKSQHGLTRLKVIVFHGVIFASFGNPPPIDDYLGPRILPWFERTFKGRSLKLLGYNRQRIGANWKLMMENIKDPYHPGLLHTWFVTFGLFRADHNISRMVIDESGRHAVMLNRKANSGVDNEVTADATSYRHNMKLEDPRLLDVIEEPWWTIVDPDDQRQTLNPTNCMQTLFPNLIIQQQVNSLSTRQIVPRGNDGFDFTWTHFGFEDDDEEMTVRRLRQANLFGPAGFVSADDGEVLELQQRGFEQDTTDACLIMLGGSDEGEVTEHMITETLIRGMYRYYRKVMSL